MKKIILLLVLTVVLFSCSSSDNNAPVVNIQKGTFAGTYIETTTQPTKLSGEITIFTDAKGNITSGIYKDSATQDNAVLDGNIDSSGNANFFPTKNINQGNGLGITFTGKVSGNNLNGTWTYTKNSITKIGTFSLLKTAN
jgi:major membrane immunogen (membrane-anchored lipoprotein)